MLARRPTRSRSFSPSKAHPQRFPPAPRPKVCARGSHRTPTPLYARRGRSAPTDGGTFELFIPPITLTGSASDPRNDRCSLGAGSAHFCPAKTVALLRPYGLHVYHRENRLYISLLLLAKTVALLPPYVRHHENRVCIWLFVPGKTIAFLPPSDLHRENRVCVSLLVLAKTVAILPACALTVMSRETRLV